MKRPVALVIASLLAGCVTPPKLAPAPEIRRPEALKAAQTFESAEAAWPIDRWWTVYGDPQLNALIDEALIGAPTMAQASARLRRAEALVGSARSALLPSVSVDGSLSLNKPSTNFGIPVLPERRGYHDYARTTLGFSWELDFWGKNKAAVAAATSDAEATRADAAAARLVVSASVAATYADLVRIYSDRYVLEETLRVRQQSLELVRARVKYGFDSDADLAQAEAGPPAARSDLAQADEAIGLTRNRLAALLGAGPDRGRLIEPPDTPALKAFGLPPNLAADLLGRRPDIVAARWRVEASGKRIKVAKAQFYPNVNLLGLLGFESLGIENLLNGGSDIGSTGPAFSLPIFDGGRRRANYRGARAEYDFAVAVYDETLTQALREVADAAVSSRQLTQEVAASKEAMDATERAYRLARIRYAQGAIDYQSVLTVEDRLLQRRRVNAALEARRFILDVALIRSLGGGVLR